jgi:hypothetical protein
MMRCKLSAAILVLLFLSICTNCGIDTGTRYHSSSGSVTGGYNSKKLEESRYRVWFLYNGFTEWSAVRKYLKFRCAEITVENGKHYFVVESEDHTHVPLKLEFVIMLSDSIPDEDEQGFAAQEVIDELSNWIADHR